MRIGTGYDVHRLVTGRKLILGGIEIPYEKGLLGHSDADVLTHAICDAILGAAGLPDIGHCFPDTDDRFKDIYSIKLLERSMDMVRIRGLDIGNIDTTVYAQAPKLSPYREKIRAKLAETLSINIDQVNMKATTTEGLGYIGKGEGIAAMCVVLLVDKQ
ncbi:MAG: 2-C-methyl-D-erythritol 2,4-cyclodiphosphate synthase [Proteobacteria bacterium]|nr:2-C-methyl-D-erythritol 2,4-cyclodiphosphate synthase [Pseudomonadota bacterium]